MKTYLLLATCVILSGCGQAEKSNREVLGSLEAIKSELAKKQPTPVRWAFANKNEISSALNKWKSDKMEEYKKAEMLSPEDAQKVEHYDALQSELSRKQMQKQMAMLRLRSPAMPFGSEATPPPDEKDLEALSKSVEEAKTPVAAIVEGRNRASAQFNGQFSVEQLVADYAKGRYDLVLDNSMFGNQDKLLYSAAAETTDVTEGVIMLFKDKTSK